MPALVSVIIPVYNKPAAFVREAVDSALAQTYRPIEVLIIDDGSTADYAWLRSAYGERVTLVRQPNGGPASARNHGIRLARGAYLAFLDADDAWEPMKLEEQVAQLERHPEAGLAYAPVLAMDRDGALRASLFGRPGPSGDIFDVVFRSNCIPTSTVIVRRECFERVGVFDEAPALISVEDYDMWLRILERYEAVGFDRPLVRYRAQGGISRDIERSYTGERLVIEKAITRQPRLQHRRPGRLAQIAFRCGHEYFSMNDLVNARRQFGRALSHRPWDLRSLGFWAATFLSPQQVDAVRRWRGRRLSAAHPLRVAHVLFSLDAGGAEYLALEILRQLPAARYDRHVVGLTGTGQLAGEFQQAGITVHVLHKRPGVDVRLWAALAALVRRERFDVVHTHNVTPWLYAGPAAVLAGARLIHTEHSNLFPEQRRLLAAERWLAPMTRWVIADSDDVRRCLVERQRLPSRNVITVRNGIDTGRFAPTADPVAARAQLALNGSGPVVGTVARLVEIKDHPTLLTAFRAVLEEFPRAVLLMVGDGPLRQALSTQAAALGMADRVRFLGRRTDIPAILPALDIFVLASRSEGLPLTVLEAMAAGIPVVATDVGALHEAVQQGRTGLLVPARAPELLAQAIRTLLRDPERRQAMGAEARRIARADFDVSGMVQRYEAAYRH